MKTYSSYIISLVCLLFLANSCIKFGDQEYSKNSSLILEYTEACGWCGGSHILVINGKNVTYDSPAICDKEAHRWIQGVNAKVVNKSGYQI